MINNSTITALATAPGLSGLSVIRLSGDKAIEIADISFSGKTKLVNAKTHTIHYGKFISDDKLLDMVTASIYKAPNSYTGEDVVEFGIHGSLLLANEIVKVLVGNGATNAKAGEFTTRAFLNGKLNLVQVEAVADLIHSVSVPAIQTSAKQLYGNFNKRLSEMRNKLLDISGLLELELDFSEEDIPLIEKTTIIKKINESIIFVKSLINSYNSANILRYGYVVSIVGYPNSGKSTLFNALLEKNRAIVSHIPGTTRDYLEETIYINGFPIKLVDTAGLRETQDEIEIAGIKLVESTLEQANMILVINDISVSNYNSFELYDNLKEKYPNRPIIYINNKIDLIEQISDEGINISAKSNIGIDILKNIIYESSNSNLQVENDILINQRQKDLLENALIYLENAINALERNYENDIISIDIRNATKILGEITGESWNEEVLAHIFSNFCIGK